MMAADGEFASLILKDFQGETLSNLESFRVQRFWYAGLINLETGFFELTENELEVQLARWQGFFSRNSVLQDTWASQSQAFHPDFVAWIDAFVLVQSE